MKKTIRLTESDLKEIVKRIIKEQVTKTITIVTPVKTQKRKSLTEEEKNFLRLELKQVEKNL